ncbi:MAG: hypothetical protein K0S65_1407 [Labilithrix sp.]|nr:hypothetical protein [Labilithrix sp.]
MRTRSTQLHFLGLFAITAMVFDATTSRAGDKAPVSSLPALPSVHDRTEPPKGHGVPGLVMKEHAGVGRSYTELIASTAQGYCIVNQEFGLRLESSTTWTEKDANELWRLVEKDGKATFERTRFSASSSGGLWVKSKTSLELSEVSRANGVIVWGFRDGSDVILLARGATGGREVRPQKPEEEGPSFLSSDCTFGAARLSTTMAKTGTLAQMRGSLPPVGEGKAKITPQFVVDSSLAKLSRDPEPVLAVRVRRFD